MCLQFRVDNYLLQVLRWALTEYGDSLQSLVNTPSLNNKFILPVSYIVTKEVSITLHYITSHHITSHHITSHHITSHPITSHYITLHYITLRYITLHYMLCWQDNKDHQLASIYTWQGCGCSY